MACQVTAIIRSDLLGDLLSEWVSGLAFCMVGSCACGGMPVAVEEVCRRLIPAKTPLVVTLDALVEMGGWCSVVWPVLCGCVGWSRVVTVLLLLFRNPVIRNGLF